MFKELKSLGVVVKQLSHKLGKLVSLKGHQGPLFIIICSPLFPLLPSPPHLSPPASSLRISSAWPLVAVMAVPGQVLNETHVNTQICLAADCICTASLESSNVLITVLVSDSFVLEPWQSESFPFSILSNPVFSLCLPFRPLV